MEAYKAQMDAIYPAKNAQNGIIKPVYPAKVDLFYIKLNVWNNVRKEVIQILMEINALSAMYC